MYSRSRVCIFFSNATSFTTLSEGDQAGSLLFSCPDGPGSGDSVSVAEEVVHRLARLDDPQVEGGHRVVVVGGGGGDRVVVGRVAAHLHGAQSGYALRYCHCAGPKKRLANLVWEDTQMTSALGGDRGQ